MPTDWTTKEQRAWAWPDQVTPSRWAEEHRILPAHVTSEPGPWRNARTPYLAGIMDAIAEPGVEEVVVIKAAQVGFSESIRNVLGFWIDREPGPCLIVMPDQKSAEELLEERIKPLLEATPAVARHVTSRVWDVKKASIRLDTMSIYLGWSGSSQSLKSRPIRYLLLEEPDEYVAISGAGGDPINKAMKRITTYSAKGRARVILGGTPTTRNNNAWRAWESCGDQRHFWVPCPHCGKYQTLIWARVKYIVCSEGETRKAHASRVMDTPGGAYYECECGGKITDEYKLLVLQRGLWAGSDQVVTADGRVTGPAAKHRRVGFHLPAMYSPWVSFGRLAAEWIEAQGDPQALADFVNQRLAEPFEEQRAKLEPSLIAEKAKGAPVPLLVPRWARLLIATADTQGNDERSGFFWYTIRAWGYGYHSQLIDYGIAHMRDELRQLCLDRQTPVDGGGMVAPQYLFVDSGGPRWQEVYQMAQADPRVHPTKGSSHARTWMVNERPQKKHNVILWEIDTGQAKDLLHTLVNDPDQGKWLPHNAVRHDYCSQMCAEAKIWNPTERREEWVEIVKDNNHIWDCEAIQAAIAWRMGCGVPEPVDKPATAEDRQPTATFGGTSKKW